jgi:hypothetical protein
VLGTNSSLLKALKEACPRKTEAPQTEEERISAALIDSERMRLRETARTQNELKIHQKG